MSTRVMVTLPDDVYHRAAHLAQLASRDVADLLAEAITLSLPPPHCTTSVSPGCLRDVRQGGLGSHGAPDGIGAG
jgi:hypothetical protein